jgi:broad specificity phosphatase PhoE
MKTIYLIRHGEVEFPLDSQGRRLVYGQETGLSQLGKEQIIDVAKELGQQKIKLEVLFVSPAKRTVETADILRTQLLIPKIIIIKDINDVSPLSWLGYPLDDYFKIRGDGYSQPKSSNQESLEHMVKRSEKAIKEIIKDKSFNVVGIVSHGDIISSIDWVLDKPNTLPKSYFDLQNHFYPSKGDVIEYLINGENNKVERKRIIRVEKVKKSFELFRGTH